MKQTEFEKRYNNAVSEAISNLPNNNEHRELIEGVLRNLFSIAMDAGISQTIKAGDKVLLFSELPNRWPFAVVEVLEGEYKGFAVIQDLRGSQRLSSIYDMTPYTSLSGKDLK